MCSSEWRGLFLRRNCLSVSNVGKDSHAVSSHDEWVMGGLCGLNTCLTHGILFFIRWEWQYDLVPLRDYMVANPWIPFAACILYGVLIVLGRAYFSTRDPWSWRKCLALWNLALSVFSAIGFVRASAQLIHNLSHYPLHDIFCNDPENSYGSGVTGVWVQFFCLSKFPYVLCCF